jgi:hypothetical protein
MSSDRRTSVQSMNKQEIKLSKAIKKKDQTIINLFPYQEPNNPYSHQPQSQVSSLTKLS